MKNMLIKEIKLAASPLSFFFILFGLMPIFPNYPILVGGFFVCLGLYNSFLSAREKNDILYSALLPVKKTDTVKSKYIFCVFIELCSFLISAVIVALRMTLLLDSPIYKSNALMNANFVYLGFLLLIFGLFNAVFVKGFFKTAYYTGKPFIIFIIAAFLTVGVAESLHYIPKLKAVNAFGFDNIGLQLICLFAGMIIFILLTLISEKSAEKRFQNIDL